MEVDSAAPAAAPAAPLAFSLRFNQLNDFSQLIEIFANIDPNTSNNGVKFDVVNNGEFQGLMMSFQRSDQSIIGIASVECIVESLDTTEGAKSCFIINISTLQILMKCLPSENMFSIKKYRGDNKVHLSHKSPSPDNDITETFVLTELESLQDEEDNPTAFFANMEFPFYILLQVHRLREFLRKAKATNTNNVMFSIEGVASTTDCSVFRIMGQNDDRSLGMGFDKSLVKSEDDGDIVYRAMEGAAPGGGHVLQRVQYNTHQILDIIKNMKPSNLRITFGKHKFLDEATGALVNSEEGNDPLFIELRLGGSSSWVRFLLAPRVDDGEF